MLRSSLILVSATFLAWARADVCGVQGDDASGNEYYSDDSGQYGSYSSCSQLCVQDTNCASLAYSADSACLLFGDAVANNIEASDDGPYVFYDRSCTSTSAPPTTTTTSTTATPPATTTVNGIVIPPGCNIPANMTIVNFNWHNTTHNCDCAASKPDVGGGYDCRNADGTRCELNNSTCPKENCAWVCSTGYDPQPYGYGPPDYVQFDYKDQPFCAQGNPQGFRNFEVGEGFQSCGPNLRHNMYFLANSNLPSSTAVVGYTDFTSCNGNTVTYSYNGSMPIQCTHDADFNATCTTPQKEVVMQLNYLGAGA